MRTVLVTTKHRGVFCGQLEEVRGDWCALQNVRCAIKFGTTGGFLELAQTGPTAESKIGSEAPRIEIYDVTSIIDCTEEAAKAWKDA